MDNPQDRFELDSQLTELSRVQPWIEALADLYGFSEDARFAMQLCVEEALANVVLHGYRSEAGHPIVMRASLSEGTLVFAIDDKASPFAPPSLLRLTGRRNLQAWNRLNPVETVSGCYTDSQDRSAMKDSPTAIDLR
jgi:hypothetical protein